MTTTPFERNRFTLSAYILLGFYAYMQASLGAIMPFVRADLSLSYTVTGFHITGFALGMVLAGISGAGFAQRMGRRRLFWGGGLGMCLGAGLFMVGQIAPLTILGTFMMGWLGTYLLVLIQSTLADEHLHHSAIALTEANIIASLFAAFAPILVGIGANLNLTWRLAPVLGGGIWMLIFFFNRQTKLPVSQSDDDGGDSVKQLPRLFWFYWVVIFLGVALEWCTLFWSAEFLDKVVQLPTEQAATISSVFLFAMVIGRVIGSRLTRYYLPRQLLWMAIGVIVLGFPMFWLGQVPIINIVGLFVVGLGISNLFPLGLSIASRVGGRASDHASSRVSMAAGLAILILPQVLGSSADVLGIFNAFAVVPIFLVLLIIMLAIANRHDTHLVH